MRPNKRSHISSQSGCETTQSLLMILLLLSMFATSSFHRTSTLLRSVSFHPVYPFITFQVNLEYLETKLESVDGEEVQRIQDNINSLFHHCVQALGEEHQIKVVNALQVSRDHKHCPFFFFFQSYRVQYSKAVTYATNHLCPFTQSKRNYS